MQSSCIACAPGALHSCWKACCGSRYVQCLGYCSTQYVRHSGNLVFSCTQVAPQHQQAISGLQLPVRRLFGSELDTEAHQGTSETLSERDFHRPADLTMGQLLGSLEDIIESHEAADSDVELGQGVLTCSLGSLGTYSI